MLQSMKKNGYEKHDQIVSVIIATYTTSAQFADWIRNGKTVETAIRTWGQNLDGRAVLGKLGDGPRRNRHTAKLKIEDLWALMSRLDRHAEQLDGLFLVEEVIASDLMFPHVAAALRELGLLSNKLPGNKSTQEQLLHPCPVAWQRAPVGHLLRMCGHGPPACRMHHATRSSEPSAS